MNTLHYEVWAKHVQPDRIASLGIAAKDLNLRMYVDDVDNWDRVLILLLDRVAELGHFERLSFSIDYANVMFVERHEMIDRFNYDDIARVADAMIREINANPRLSFLNLSDTYWPFDWAPHLQDIFRAMGEHTNMKELIVEK